MGLDQGLYGRIEGTSEELAYARKDWDLHKAISQNDFENGSEKELSMEDLFRLIKEFPEHAVFLAHGIAFLGENPDGKVFYGADW